MKITKHLLDIPRNPQLWKQMFRNLATLGTGQIIISLEQLLDIVLTLLRKATSTFENPDFLGTIKQSPDLNGILASWMEGRFG